MVIKNKRGQDLSIGTLILIVLGIVVLVILILGFSLGWANLWEKIGLYGGGSSIGDLIKACDSKVALSNKYGYCNEFTLLTLEGGQKAYLNCDDSRVKTSLRDTMTCDNSDTTIKEFCGTLAKTDKLKADTRVNSQLCSALDCEALGGITVGLAQDLSQKDAKCILSDNTYPKNKKGEELRTKITAGYGDVKDNNICCLPNPTFN